MPHNSTRSTQLTVLASAALIGTALLGALAHQSSVSPLDSAEAATVITYLDQLAPPDVAPPRVGVTAADGVVPDGVPVYDDTVPAIANLDPDLLAALRRAATDAARHGVEFKVTSGWRSPGYQDQLLREAVSQYGSEEAARWVATPTTSAHVSGDAADIGPPEAAAWLSLHGAAYGLCQIYANEPWHYELRPLAVDERCPSPYADPTQDPRMQ